MPDRTLSWYSFYFKISKTSVSWPVSTTVVQTSIKALGSDIRLHSRQHGWYVPSTMEIIVSNWSPRPPLSPPAPHFLPYPLHGTEPYVLLALPFYVSLTLSTPLPPTKGLLWDFIPSCLGHYSSLKLPCLNLCPPIIQSPNNHHRAMCFLKCKTRCKKKSIPVHFKIILSKDLSYGPGVKNEPSNAQAWVWSWVKELRS